MMPDTTDPIQAGQLSSEVSAIEEKGYCRATACAAQTPYHTAAYDPFITLGPCLLGEGGLLAPMVSCTGGLGH